MAQESLPQGMEAIPEIHFTVDSNTAGLLQQFDDLTSSNSLAALEKGKEFIEAHGDNQEFRILVNRVLFQALLKRPDLKKQDYMIVPGDDWKDDGWSLSHVD